MKKICVMCALIFVLVAIGVVSFAEETYTATKIINNGFGNTNNIEVFVYCYYNGKLYAGTHNSAEGSSLWKSSDGTNWNVITQTIGGFGDSKNTEIMAMCSWKGYLYASTRNYATGTELWRSADGLSWSQVNSDGFGLPSTNKARFIVPYQSQLFVTTGNYNTGGKVWASANGTDWNQVNDSGFGDAYNTDVAAATVFDGYLYCATAKAQETDKGIKIWRYDGSLWFLTKTGGFGDTNNVFPTSMLVFNNFLYVGTENNNTIGEVWRSQDGFEWERVAQITGITYAPVLAIGAVEDSHIYACGSSGRNDSFDALYTSMDGQNWNQVVECSGFPKLVFNGSLYVTSENLDNNNLNEVYKLTRNSDQNCSGDINADNKIGLEEAIHALQVVSGTTISQ